MHLELLEGSGFEVATSSCRKGEEEFRVRSSYSYRARGSVLCDLDRTREVAQDALAFRYGYRGIPVLLNHIGPEGVICHVSYNGKADWRIQWQGCHYRTVSILYLSGGIRYKLTSTRHYQWPQRPEPHYGYRLSYEFGQGWKLLSKKEQLMVFKPDIQATTGQEAIRAWLDDVWCRYDFDLPEGFRAYRQQEVA
jgi:hypothetical protein